MPVGAAPNKKATKLLLCDSCTCNPANQIFWAEVFLMSQEGCSGELRWQKVVPKLVPVNVACVQNEPTVVNHVTAYNTKVDKVLDVLICSPEIALHRPSECFVYWEDPQKGLTWGLNFITAEDTTHFINLVQGNAQGMILSRRANSSTQLTSKSKEKQLVMNSISNPNTPDPIIRHMNVSHVAHSPTAGAAKLTVRFTDQPTVVEVPPHSDPLPTRQLGYSAQQFAANAPPLKFPQAVQQLQSYIDESVVSSSSSAAILKRLSERELGIAGPLFPNSAAALADNCESKPVVASEAGPRDSNLINSSSGTYDNLKQYNVSCPLATNADMSLVANVWQLRSEKQQLFGQTPPANADNNDSTLMALSLDSVTMRNLISAAPNDGHFSVGSLDQNAIPLDAALSEKPAVFEEARQFDKQSSQEKQLSSCPIASSDSGSTLTGDRIAEMSRDHKVYVFSHEPDSASLSSTDTARTSNSAAEVTAILQQNDQKILLRPAKQQKTKRSSIHLIAGENGRFRSVGGSALKNNSSPRRFLPHTSAAEEADETTSLSSQENNAVSAPMSQSLILGNSDKGSFANKVRRVGFVLMKSWLSPDVGGIRVLHNETWHHYWASLQGVSLSLYAVNDQSLAMKMAPNHGISAAKESRVIDISKCLVQPLPEYPRRQDVFCISTSTGHAFLFQVTDNCEVESWVQNLHVSAAFGATQTSSRDIAARIVRREIEKLDQKIEQVSKMIRLTVLPSVSSLSAQQIGSWEKQLENLQLQHFIAKCYWAALKGADLPNCKKLLASATRSTKSYLNQVGAFTASTVHAQLACLLNPLPPEKPPPPPAPISSASCVGADILIDSVVGSDSYNHNQAQSKASLVQISMPNHQVAVVSIADKDTVDAVLKQVCLRCSLNTDHYFMLLRRNTSPNEIFIPADSDALQSAMIGCQLEVREKLVYHVHLERPADKPVFGLTIRAQRDPIQNCLQALVTALDPEGVAKRRGLLVGDELITINQHFVKKLNSASIEELLQRNDQLCLVLRTRRLALPIWLECISQFSSNENLHLSCVSSRQATSDTEDLNPNWILTQLASSADSSAAASCAGSNVKYRNCSANANQKCSTTDNNSSVGNNKQKQRHSLPILAPSLMSTSMVSESNSTHSSPNHYDHRHSMVNGLSNRISAASESGCQPSTSAACQNFRGSQNLQPSERLERLIFEIIETEKCFVEDLEMLVRQYLEPLATSELLPRQETSQLLQCVEVILKFQRNFLEDLKEAAGTDVLASKCYLSPTHLRKALLHIGGVFVNQAPRFKAYSSFCAAHFKIQKFLQQKDSNAELARFLAARNIDRQHSASLESYLIKPVQRVLRYPLFLQQIKALTSAGTPEHLQISEALVKMQKAAEYINEMQRIYEEHGETFTQLQEQNKKLDVSLDLGSLLIFGEVEWLNPADGNGNRRKQSALQCICFVFRSAIVLLGTVDKSRVSKRSKAPLDCAQIQRLMPIKEIEVNGSDLGSTDSQHMWILIHVGHSSRVDKVYHFANRKHELKQQFLKAIRRAGLSLTKSAVQDTSIRSPAASPDCNADKHIAAAVQLNGTLADGAAAAVARGATDLTQGKTTHLKPLAADHATEVNGLSDSGGEKRPASYYSSQSDAGYGSNSDVNKEIAAQLRCS